MRRWMLAAALLMPLFAQVSPLQALLQSLPREAAAFSGCAASQMYSREVITHREATPGFKARKLVSDYSFVQMRDAGEAIREVRHIRELDGKRVKAESSLEAMASAFAGGSEKQKRQQLEQLARLGLRSVATDLGQMLLLFSAGSMPNYEFRHTGDELLENRTPVWMFTFTQIDGPAGMRVFKDGETAARQPRYKGIVWLRKQDSRLAKIALDSEAVGGASQRLIVDYEPHPGGCVMPVAAAHREIGSNGAVLVENTYTYEPFRPLAGRSQQP